MIRFRNFLPLVTGLLVAAVISSASPARAAFEILVNSGSTAQGTAIFVNPGGVGSSGFGAGNITNIDTNNINSTETIQTLSFLYAGYQINVTSTTNTPGVNGVAFQTSNTITVTNVSGLNPVTIDVFASGYDIAGVGAQLAVVNSISTLNGVAGGTAGDYSEVNGSVATSTATLTTGVIGAINTYGDVTLGTSPFSMDTVLTISNLSAGGTDNVDFSTTANVVPAPAGLVLALTSMPVFALGYWWKRREVRPQVAV